MTKTVTYKVTDQRVKFALKKSSLIINQGNSFSPYDYVNYVKTYKGKALNIKSNVMVEGNVDTTKPGTYTITYTAKYKNRDYTARTRTLKVVVEPVVEETTTPEETTTVPEETTTVSEETTTVPVEATTAPEETTASQEETTV